MEEETSKSISSGSFSEEEVETVVVEEKENRPSVDSLDIKISSQQLNISEEKRKFDRNMSVAGSLHSVEDEEAVVKKKVTNLQALETFMLNYSQSMIIILEEINKAGFVKVSTALQSQSELAKCNTKLFGSLSSFSHNLDRICFSPSNLSANNLMKSKEIVSCLAKMACETKGNCAQMNASQNLTKTKEIESKANKISQVVSNNIKLLKKAVEKLSVLSQENQKIRTEIFNSDRYSITSIENEAFLMEMNLVEVVNNVINELSEMSTTISRALGKYLKMYSELTDEINSALKEIKENTSLFIQTNFESEINPDAISLQNNKMTAFTPSNFFKIDAQVKVDKNSIKIQSYFAKFAEKKRRSVMDFNKFSVKEYTNLADFLSFLFSLNLPKCSFEGSVLVETVMKLRRDSGFFSGWKESLAILTLQKNFLLFDEEVSRGNLVEAMEKELVWTVKSQKGSNFFELKGRKARKYIDKRFSYICESENKEVIAAFLNPLQRASTTPF